MARRLKMCHQERAPTAKHVYIAHNCAVRSKRGDLSSHVRPELVLDDHTQLGNKLAWVLRASHQLRARRMPVHTTEGAEHQRLFRSIGDFWLMITIMLGQYVPLVLPNLALPRLPADMADRLARAAPTQDALRHRLVDTVVQRLHGDNLPRHLRAH